MPQEACPLSFTSAASFPSALGARAAAMRCHESDGSGPLTLLALPAELLHRALGAVGPADLLAAGASCTALHAIAGDSHLWREQPTS